MSEEDAKKGKAVGDVSLFAFRGVADGRYRILSTTMGAPLVLRVLKSMRVIKEYQQGEVVGRIPYNPASIIGAAFENAFNGFLEVSRERATLLAVPYAAPSTPDNQSPPAADQPHNLGADRSGF